MPWSRPRTGVKRGPKPFPGSLRKRCDLRVPPLQPVRHNHRYPRKRKIDVLIWLINHRVADTRKNEFGEPPAPRLKSGQVTLTEEELRAIRYCRDPIIWRPPTYQEAEKFWNIRGAIIASWWQLKDKYLPPEEIEKSRWYMIRSSPNRDFKPPPEGQSQSVAQNSAQPSALQPTLDATTQPRPGATQSQGAVVEISDDSESDPGGFTSDDDEESPSTEDAVSNARNAENDQMDKDIQELQKILDDSDTDIAPETNGGAPVVPQDPQNDDNEDAEGSEDPELFGTI